MLKKTRMEVRIVRREKISSTDDNSDAEDITYDSGTSEEEQTTLKVKKILIRKTFDLGIDVS